MVSHSPWTEDEVCNALRELIQHVIDLDPRIIAIEIELRTRRELSSAHVEVKIAREAGH